MGSAPGWAGCAWPVCQMNGFRNKGLKRSYSYTVAGQRIPSCPASHHQHTHSHTLTHTSSDVYLPQYTRAHSPVYARTQKCPHVHTCAHAPPTGACLHAYPHAPTCGSTRTHAGTQTVWAVPMLLQVGPWFLDVCSAPPPPPWLCLEGPGARCWSPACAEQSGHVHHRVSSAQGQGW